MLPQLTLSALVLAGSAVAQVVDIKAANINKYTATSTAAVDAAAATAKTTSPTSNVKGRAFNRFVEIWFENTDYSLASTDPNFAYFATKGITLSNYYGITHPSMPNYIASAAGDVFGCDNDAFTQIPNDIYTVVDLLEDRGISWATYQEGMPYSGYEGYNWINGSTGQNNYVRKHHPAVIFNKNTESNKRLSHMKNFTMLNEDLANMKLPQWMFITPNMLNDGHDTDVTYAGQWLRTWLEPLLSNSYFMKDTLILITFDETETYSIKNNVFSILLGGAVPAESVGTTDKGFYNHFSDIATVEANWGLHTLGRWDVGANVFSPVAKLTGDTVRPWTKTDFANVYLNDTFAGPLNYYNSSVGWPVPNIKAEHNGRTVLPEIVSMYKDAVNKTFYTTGVEINWGQNPPAGFVDSYD